MRVNFINNDGGGFADKVEVGYATTVKDFFSEHMGDASASKYRIKVNGAPARPEQELQDGDKVSITPMNVKGA